MNAVSFMSANFVARETGWAMHGWGHGDSATNDAFRPLDTFAARFDDLLGDVVALGFDTIDLWGGHLNPAWASDTHVELAVGALAEHGLRVGSYQVYAPEPHLERACAIAAALGTTSLSGFVPLDDPRLAGLLDRHALRFALENHPEPDPATMLAKTRGRELVGVCVDTGWFATQGYDPARAIEELGDQVLHVHLKDVLHEGEPHETCRWGDGIVDVERCVRALQEIAYDGVLVVEHEPERYDPSADVAAMRAQLVGWLT